MEDHRPFSAIPPTASAASASPSSAAIDAAIIRAPSVAQSAASTPAAAADRNLPAHVLDAPRCLTERGFAFVSEFGKAFAHLFNKSMGAYFVNKRPQHIAGEVCIQSDERAFRCGSVMC
jgi:hypothetical protein